MRRSLSFSLIAIGVIAALGFQRHGHSLEAQSPEPFTDRDDALQRLLVEQRFVLSGGWWRAWKERHRHRH